MFTADALGRAIHTRQTMLLQAEIGPRAKSESNFEDSLPARGVAKDRVVINVGGYRHETYLSTLRVVPDSRLAWIAENAAKQADYDPENNEFFFDRHPGIFVNIMNYYRTGKLHCPSDVCGPLFEEELLFWGIDELQMEPCCWSNYTQHREAQATLKAFEGLQKSVDDSENESSAFRVHRKVATRTKWKREIWAMLEKPYSSKYAQMFAFVSLIVIILSVATFCLQSIRHLGETYEEPFKGIEYFYLVWFTADFLARLCTCPSIRDFFKNFMTWVDITSVIPLYITVFPTAVSGNLKSLFVLRLIRIFRLFRFFRAMSGMQVIGHTLKASARELFLLVLILLIPMVIFSTLVFYAEGNSPHFKSIPESFWWAVITMTTVGYGDVYPKSPLGKVIGTVCACVGVLIVALPVSVIGSNFTLFYSHAQAQLRLPKKKRTPLLLGAAGALVSETTLYNEDNSDEDAVRNMSPRENISMPRKSLRNPSITPRCRSIRRETALPPPFSKVESSTSVEMEATTPTVKKSAEELFSSPPNGSGMDLSSGLRGVSDVMLHITAPSHRRMAISPAPSPPVRRPSQRRRRRGGSKRLSNRENGEMSSHDKDGDSNYYTTTDGESAGESGISATKSKTIPSLQENYGGTIESSNESNTSEDKGNLRKRDDNVTEGIRSYLNSGTRVNLEGATCDSSKDYKTEVVAKAPTWKSSENLSENKEENKISAEPRLRSKSELVTSETPPCKRRNAITAKGATALPISPLVRSDDRLHRSASNGPFKKAKETLSARNSYDPGGLSITEDEKDTQPPKAALTSVPNNSAVENGNTENLQISSLRRPPKLSYIKNTTRV